MYDAIVIGARCGRAATAMLLARAGLDVLLVDRAALPSETPHGHFVHRHGPAAAGEVVPARPRPGDELPRGDVDDVGLWRLALTAASPSTASRSAHWGDVACAGLELYCRPEHVIFVFPTNDGLVGLFVGFATAELARVRADPEAAVLAAADVITGLGERIRAGRREERFYGATQLPNFLRTPHGPGWALVGDAGCHKDPFMALGICDALRDAELLSEPLVAGLTGRRPVEAALVEYARRRDAATLPDMGQNLAMARFEPLSEEHLGLRAALRGNQRATDHYFLATQGMVAPQTFFNDENLRRIHAGAAGVSG